MTALSTVGGLSATVRRLNPVFDRELRQRSRSGRSLMVMVVFLLLATGVGYLAYLGETAAGRGGFDAVSILSRSVGRTMFEWVLILELVLLLFVVPGLSAGAITGERDRQTLIPLQVTLIGPLGIYFGKVLSASSFVLLLVVTSTPIMAAAYLLGGITVGQVLISMLNLIVIGILLAMIGVACSALARTTVASTLFSYGFTLLLTVGTVVAFAALFIGYLTLFDRSGDQPPTWMSLPFAFNPFVALASSAGDITDANLNSPWPLSGIKQVFHEWFNNPWMNDVAIAPDGAVIDAQDAGPLNRLDSTAWFGLKMWLVCVVGMGGLSALMAWRSIERLRTPARVVRQ